MKNIINIISIFIILFVLIFSVDIYAASLSTVNVSVDKQKINPGDTVKLLVEFGQNLGSYTVDVAYDNTLLEYVSVEGGTANDTGTKVRVYYYDQTGGTSPRNSMSVTFKAKSTITDIKSTNLSVTMEGLANADASVTYDDITTPIVRNITIEPKTTTGTITNAISNTTTTGTNNIVNTNNQTNTININKVTKVDNTIQGLPQTGNTMYFVIGFILIILGSIYIYLIKRK